MALFQRFKSDQRGTTAILFGLAFLPVLGLAGAAMDYSRATMAQSRMQLALDLAALSIVKLPVGASQAEIDKLAKNTLESTMGMTIGTRSDAGVTLSTPSVTRTGKIVSVKAAATSDSVFMQVLGFRTTTIGAKSQAVWSAKKIELALVLDNTGSMADRPGGVSKIGALKSSAKQLLSDLRGIAKEPDTVKVSIVPFDTEVRLDPATYRWRPWFRWNDPRQDPANWTGYVYERHGSFALTADAPSASEDSRYPAPLESEYRTNATLRALSTSSGRLASVQPLRSLYNKTDHDALVSTIESMQPRGYTNVSLGATWGLVTLTPNSPLPEAAPASDKDVVKYMIILTDGKNNYRHVDGRLVANTDSVNRATSTACTNAKKAGVQIFTIKLVEGDENLLRGCASPASYTGACVNSGSYYFDVQDAAQLGTAFRCIVDAISGTRITS